MPVVEADILGRRIEKLFVSSTLDLTQNATPVYTIGTSPFILPSNKEYIAYVQLQVLTGSPQSGTATFFGLSAVGNEWNGTASADNANTDYPLIMFYPASPPTQRPGPFQRGQVFWMNRSTGYNAGSTGILTLYGFPY